MGTKEIRFTDTEDSEHGNTECGSLDGNYEQFCFLTDASLPLDRRGIGALDGLIDLFFFITIAILPAIFNDLASRSNEGEEGREAAYSSKDSSYSKGELVGRGDDVDIVR